MLTIALLNKSDLSILNKRSLMYTLADAEKDYFLAIVSKIIYDSPLKHTLVFKGGTALHHCYLPQTRFSEDLDFTAVDKSITVEDVKAVLESHDFLHVKKEYVSDATIKIERLQYNGPLGLPNSLKVEIDVFQNVVLPPKKCIYRNNWGITTNVNVMDIKEICAEKIRATSDRAVYRDFYDLVLIFDTFKLHLKEITKLIKKKEIRKPITQESIRKNWKQAKQEKKADLTKIYYAQTIPDAAVENLIKKLNVNIG